MSSPSMQLCLSRHEANMWFPHEVGRLVIRAPKYELGLGVAEVIEDPDRSDVLRLQYRIADETGHAHIADAYIGVERLWRTLAGSTARVSPPQGELTALYENAKIFVDGRDDWVFIFQEASPTTIGPANIAVVREHYFSASLSIHCLTSFSSVRFYAKVSSQVDIQRLDGSEIPNGTEFWYESPL